MDGFVFYSNNGGTYVAFYIPFLTVCFMKCQVRRRKALFTNPEYYHLISARLYSYQLEHFMVSIDRVLYELLSYLEYLLLLVLLSMTLESSGKSIHYRTKFRIELPAKIVKKGNKKPFNQRTSDFRNIREELYLSNHAKE